MTGDLAAEVNGAGERTAYRYDGRGRRTETRDNEGKLVARTTYDGVGNVVSQADGAGNRQLFAYDALDRQVARSVPVNAGAEPPGGVNWSQTPGGFLRRQSLDAWGGVIGVEDAGGGTARGTYDRLGRLVASTDAAGLSLTYDYDALDQLVAVHYPPVSSAGENAPATAVRYVFDPFNGRRLRAVVDRAGNTTNYGYDALGRRVSQGDAASGTSAYGYDALGRLTSLANAKGEETRWAYDAFNQVVKVVHPDHVAGTHERVETL